MRTQFLRKVEEIRRLEKASQPTVDPDAAARAEAQAAAARATRRPEVEVEAPEVATVERVTSTMNAGQPEVRQGVIDGGERTVIFEATEEDVVPPPPKVTLRQRLARPFVWFGRKVRNGTRATLAGIRNWEQRRRDRKAARRAQRIAEVDAATAAETEHAAQHAADVQSVVAEERRQTIMENRRLWAERGKRAFWTLLVLLALAILFLILRKYGIFTYLGDKARDLWTWSTPKQVRSESGGGKPNLVGESSTKRIITETAPTSQPIVINTSTPSTQPVPAVVVNVNSGVTKTVEVRETPEETKQRIENDKQKNKWEETYREFFDKAKENKLQEKMGKVMEVHSPTARDGRRYLAFFDGTETDDKQFVKFVTAPFDAKGSTARVFAMGTAPSLPPQNLAGYYRTKEETTGEGGSKSIKVRIVDMAATSEVAAQYLVYSENVTVSSKPQDTSPSDELEYVNMDDGVMFCGHKGRKRYDWYYDGLELDADHKPTGRRNPVNDPMKAGRGYLIISPCPIDEVFKKHPNIYFEARQKFEEKYGKPK